ncbi:alpha-amylase family glycosyl hydrolase [uncultured Duncaniella sp.]|uniref:alpha-amylase family glycosyl hydrolase n=1 Tax=uncultured Duncaniella sp. TaxID=2768039 RepID=UPI0025F32746|nr:alpha-amylase family glycosyl hydrolase [uncultured Duncaniella sp.]
MDRKPIIYQLLPRLFTNTNNHCLPNGTYAQNGSGKMNDITDTVLAGIKELGATHVWYTGVIEHATKTDYSSEGIRPDNPYVVKGQAGSPYAIKDYYDIDPDLAVDVKNRMGEFEALVARTHDAGLEVVIDFVPNHTARRYYSDAKPAGIRDFGEDDNTEMFFSPNNNYYYITRQLFAPSIDLGTGKKAYIEFPAKATGDDCFSAFPGVNNWYETVKLNYGRDPGNWTTHFRPIPDTWMKMLHILRFWASKGVDAFRCDMAHMVPLEFWQWAIPNVKDRYPRIKFIAELYDVKIYRDFIEKGGFDYLYDKVNLYDTLRGIQCSNYSAATITNCWQTVEGISGNMLNFLENHDEQRFGSKFYAGDPAKVIPSLVVSSMISTGPMLIYAGQELGEQATDTEGFSGYDGRTTIFDYWSVATLRRWYNNGKPDGSQLTPRERWLRAKYCTILGLCNRERAIAHGRFFDLMYVNYQNPTLNPHRQYVFIRSCDGETLLIAVNFSSDSCDLAIEIPRHAFDMLNIPEGEVVATELITREQDVKELSTHKPFRTMIPPYDAVIWKIRHRQVKPLSDRTLKA